ncbi:MAG: hypothetical protein GWP15_00420 [Nitrospirae bacterium]|nr:hypothetical protein [Nitrospirota bacterium]
MSKVNQKLITSHLSFLVLSVFWLVALFNPVFKKYDYGAGFPLVIVFGVLLIVLAVREFREKREKTILSGLFLFLFVACIAASFMYSQTKNFGFSEVLAWGSMVPLYYLYAYKKNDWIRNFLKIILIGAVGAVVVGYFLYFFKAETRFIGTFFNTLYHAHVWPNAFALFLIMAWPIFLLFFEKKGKWVTSILIGLILSALLLTFSRGAWIVLGGQLVLLFIYFFRRIKFKTVLLILLAGVFAIGLFWQANTLRSLNHDVIDVQERVSFGNSEGLTSKQERVDFWLGAIELTTEKPLFGWGPYSFRYAYNPIQKTFLGNADHPHNLFLKISAEYGLVALFAFLAFLVTILITVIKRFPDLSQKKKDSVYILCVAVAGAFAHNLIDYNLNFFANLLLLFLLIIFIRSLVVGRSVKLKRAFLALILALAVGLFSLYEGSLLVLSHVVDESYLEYSFFPRNYYLNEADGNISERDFEESLKYSEKQIELNPLDAQAWYLRSEVYCDFSQELFDLERCRKYSQKTLQLNPMNDFVYYRDYFKTLSWHNVPRYDIEVFIDDTVPLLLNYFEYVDNNVHFTAYTKNVEAASELIDALIPYLPYEQAQLFETENAEMLEVAEELRSNKTF